MSEVLNTSYFTQRILHGGFRGTYGYPPLPPLPSDKYLRSVDTTDRTCLPQLFRGIRDWPVYSPKWACLSASTHDTNKSTISTQPPLYLSAHGKIHWQVYSTYQLAWIQFNEGVGSILVKCGGQESPIWVVWDWTSSPLSNSYMCWNGTFLCASFEGRQQGKAPSYGRRRDHLVHLYNLKAIYNNGLTQAWCVPQRHTVLNVHRLNLTTMTCVGVNTRVNIHENRMFSQTVGPVRAILSYSVALCTS